MIGKQSPSSTDKDWNPVPGIWNPQPGIQNPRLFSIPLVHRAITGIYLPNFLSFLSSGGVDNLLFSVSGLLSISAS